MKTTLLLFLGFAACSTVQTAEADPSLIAANQALVDYRDLLQHVLRQEGANPNQELMLGEPIDVYSIDAAQLASGGTPPLRDTGHRLFPVLNRAGEVVTGMTMVRTPEGWKIASAGAKDLAARMNSARAALGRDAKLVQIHALGVDLISAGPDRMMPLFDHEALGLRAAQAEPASAVMSRLAAGAVAHLSRPSDF